MNQQERIELLRIAVDEKTDYYNALSRYHSEERREALDDLMRSVSELADLEREVLR